MLYYSSCFPSFAFLLLIIGRICYPSDLLEKPLGCYGDGGAIFTDDDAIDQRLRSLRANGRSPEDKYDNREVGFNSRLDTLQAAILLPKFRAFAGHHKQRGQHQWRPWTPD